MAAFKYFDGTSWVELAKKSDIPTNTNQLTNGAGFITSAALSGYATQAWVEGKNYTSNTGTVTQVKVGSTAYNPSSGVISLPSYPSVSNATITIKQTGVSDQTFTLNGSATTITLADTNTTYSVATTSANGLMSSTDKTNLDAIVASLNNDDTDSTVNRLKDILSVFNNYPEGTTVLSALNAKVSTSTTVNGHALTGNVTVTAADVGAVRYDTNSQGLSDTQKSNARTNIGAGTSNFSGSYNDLTNKPTIPSAVTESTVSGWGFTKNAGTVTQVKIGTTAYNPSSGVVSLPAYPTTLPASDVSSWAKASTKPTYTANEVGALPSSTNYAGSSSQGGAATVADNMSYLTSAPTSNNTSGRLKFVVLSSEPSTKYSGYVYIITG